ncbi:MAG TPA: DUF917 domain-containing protein, partial [Patescibacteria group bacterium]|nr:DUF917 domain-containing protein [Patescibacteria group bacterium]
NNKVFATSPDRIMTIDVKTFLGVHNSQLEKGQQIAVLVAPASPMWRRKEGIELFHPKHFGFSFEPKLLG